jgi:hypothetical protein
LDGRRKYCRGVAVGIGPGGYGVDVDGEEVVDPCAGGAGEVAVCYHCDLVVCYYPPNKSREKRKQTVR